MNELSAEQVLAINRQHELGRTPEEIARFLGCDVSHVIYYLDLWGFNSNSSDNEWTDYS